MVLLVVEGHGYVGIWNVGLLQLPRVVETLRRVVFLLAILENPLRKIGPSAGFSPGFGVVSRRLQNWSPNQRDAAATTDEVNNYEGHRGRKVTN